MTWQTVCLHIHIVWPLVLRSITDYLRRPGFSSQYLSLIHILPDSRWYSGAGIYRPVWLWRGAKRHIKPDSVYVTTLSIQPVEMMIEVRELPADVRAEDIDIEITYKNDVIWQGMAQAVKKNGTVTAVVQIPDARLWDVNQPNLYQCQVTLKDHGQPADCHKTTFGIRKIAWSPDGLQMLARIWWSQ